jgi:hypothetical protein
VPTALVVLCFFNYFEIWGKAMVTMGLEDFAFSPIFDETRVESGAKVI